MLSSGSKTEAAGFPMVLLLPYYIIPCDIKPWEMTIL